MVYLIVSTAFMPTTTGGSDWTAIWLGLGLVLGTTGLAIRAFSLGYVASGTSGRATVGMRADTLNTTEAYSLVRHPLYLGNLFLWLGAAAFVGRPLVIVLTGLLFWVYYERIMIAEESYLTERFEERFADWAANTPALFPGARSAWQRSDSEFSFRHSVGRDYQAVYGFVATTFVIQAVRVSAQESLTEVSPIWWGYFLVGTGFYLVIHTVKRRTRWLNASLRGDQ